MKRIILGILLIVIITLNVQTSFGYNVIFEEWGTRIQNTPTICIMKPDYEDDKYLTEIFANRLMSETRIAIDEWEVHLKQSERTKDKSMWEINQIEIPFEEQMEFNYEECNVFIHFSDKPELEEDWFKVLGVTSYEQGSTGRSEITIYYAGIEICKTEDKKFIYYDPCYKDSPRLMQQLSSAVKHEFGHALGLGHYVSDDMQVNIDWARGYSSTSSIMAVFSHQNINENRITPVDIDKIRSMYGEIGFFQNKTIEKNTFQSFESSLQEYSIPKGGFQIATIDGGINTEKFISGIPVILEITRPDGTNVLTDIKVSSDGGFNLQKILDSSVANGTYFAIASYRGEKSNEITFNIIKDEVEKRELKIPLWIKNYAKWYGSEETDDTNLKIGITHMIKKGLIEIPDWTEQTENQESKIPEWVRNIAKWWSEDQISDKDFINEIKFLVENGIIKI